MTELSNALSTAEIATAECRRIVGRINGAISAAQAVVNGSEKRRAEHALASAVGDASATAAMKRVHADDAGARLQLADLTLALIPAKAALASAEAVELAARKAMNKALAQQLMRKRIAIAARIDKVLADFDTLARDFENVGDELKGYYLEMFGQQVSISALETAFGPARISAALPPLFAKIFPIAVRPERRVQLETSEREFWQLPDTASAKATA